MTAFPEYKTYKHILLILGVLGIMYMGTQGEVGMAAGEAVIQVDVATGNDGACTRSSGVCKTIQRAVDIALSGDTVMVAPGVYTADSGSQVVNIVGKSLTLIGSGYLGGSITVIDGGQTRRCVSAYQVASLTMEGFVIQNGYFDQGIDADTNVFGGGMLLTRTKAVFRRMLFKHNVVSGEVTGGVGGAGSGGGLAIRESPQGTTLKYIIFEENQARGGIGSIRGGYALGGGLYTLESVVSGSYITFTHNSATGGNSSGSGEYWGKADALGGGLSMQAGSSVVFDHVVAAGNVATGGDAMDFAGGAFGGALFSEGQVDKATNFTLRDANIYNNQAIGGNSPNGNGGHAGGGGGQFDKSSVSFERVYVLNNVSLGGNGAKENGPAGGGGLYLQNLPGADITVSFVNTVIADNLVRLGNGTINQGGGGGGFWLQCMNDAQIVHSTIANNHLEVQGQSLGWVQGYAINVGNDGCLNVPSYVRINYSIISGHTGTALHVKQYNTAVLDYTLWNNTDNTNTGDWQAGTIIETNTVSQAGNPAYVSPGSPSYDYHILKSSDAKDKAVGSVLTTDIDGDGRTDGLPDVGADERNQAIILTASSVDASTLRLNWRVEASQLPGLHHYWIVYLNESGANPPDEGGSPIDVGMVTTYQLTGLSTYRKYTLTVNAYDVTGQLLDNSNTVVAFPTDIFVYLPLVMKW